MGAGLPSQMLDFPPCGKDASGSEMGAGSNTEDKPEEAPARSRARPGKEEGSEGGRRRSPGGQEAEKEKESMMMELTRLVQKTVKESSWWERRGIDCSILAAAFFCLPPGRNAASAGFQCVCGRVCVRPILMGFIHILSVLRTLFPRPSFRPSFPLWAL